VSEVTELWNLDQYLFLKIYFLFNSKLNGRKLGFNTPFSFYCCEPFRIEFLLRLIQIVNSRLCHAHNHTYTILSLSNLLCGINWHLGSDICASIMQFEISLKQDCTADFGSMTSQLADDLMIPFMSGELVNAFADEIIMTIQITVKRKHTIATLWTLHKVNLNAVSVILKNVG